MSHTQRWHPPSPELLRVQERAKANKSEAFTSLAHYLTPQALLRGYRSLRGNAAPGLDGEDKASYGKGLKQRLNDLHERLKGDRYRATPAKRHYLDKPDGGQRPIQLQTIEDKIVQSAVVEILNSIYEVDFAPFSYGFRPKRSQHQALQAVQTALQKGEVNWVLDLDLKACFDQIEHSALKAQLKKRVKDRRLLKLIDDWITVGYQEEDGQRVKQHRGIPQGAVISPLLANIVLNEALDKCVHRYRKERARGQIYIVRYADDAVIGFEHKADADALRAALEAKLADYGLELNQAKTRLIRFSRHTPPKGPDKSETFDFLGLTHIAGRDRRGRYLVRRKTARKRIKRSLEHVKQWCKRHRHEPLRWQWEQLSMKLTGHYRYYGVRGNLKSLARFRAQVWRIWRQSLLCRSQKSRKARLTALLNERYRLPPPKIMRPDNWLPINPGDLLGRAGCGKAARPVL